MSINNPSPQIKPEELTEAFKRALDRPITWRSIVRAGLIWGAEYALLSLIEDAPVVLKVATILCAIGALAALEGEEWLNRRHRHFFKSVTLALVAIYLGFIGYALHLVAKDAAVRLQLDELYNESVPIMSEATPFMTRGASADELKSWEGDIQTWRNKTETYLTKNLGQTFAFRFANTLGHPSYGYGVAQEEVNVQLNFLLTMQNNLLGIRDALGYGK